MAAAGVLVVSAAVPAQAAGGLRHGATMSGCSRVLFVGARGSGETWNSGATPGMGPELSYVLAALRSDLAGYPVVQAMPVHYLADDVLKLVHSNTRALYFQHLAQGVSWTLNYLATQASLCPTQEIVLAGYSQGAMVMHRVLNSLATTNPAILSRVRNAVLIGDGDKVPFDTTAAGGWSGHSPPWAEGVGLLYTRLSGSSTTKFSPSVGARVLSVCAFGDVVCDEPDVIVDCGTNLLCWAAAIYIHTHYPGLLEQGLLTAAAQQVAYDVA